MEAIEDGFESIQEGPAIGRSHQLLDPVFENVPLAYECQRTVYSCDEKS